MAFLVKIGKRRSKRRGKLESLPAKDKMPARLAVQELDENSQPLLKDGKPVKLLCSPGDLTIIGFID